MDAGTPGHGSEIGVHQRHAGLEEAGGLHLHLDEAERAVIQHHDLHGQLVLVEGQKVTHQHGEAAIAGKGNHLPPRIGRLRADRLRHGVGHGAVVEGADQPPPAVHREVARRPDRRRADVEGEDGVLRSRLAERPGDVLRVHRAAGLADRQGVEAGAGLAVMGEAVVEMSPVGLRPQLRQQRRDRGADIADQAEVDPAMASEASGAQINLRDLGLLRVELAVGEARAEEQEGVAVEHRPVARREPDQPSHAHVVGVVPLDVLLAAERVDYGRLQRLGELQQLGMGPGASAPAEQRHPAGRIEHPGQRVEVGVPGPHHGRGRHQGARQGRRVVGHGHEADIAGDDDHRHAALGDGDADRGLDHAGQLRGRGDQFAIVAALLEQVLRVGLLEVAAADLRRGDLGSDGQDGHAGAVRVEQAVDEVQVPRPAGAGADRERAGQVRLGAGREGGALLVAGVDPGDRAVLAQGFGQPVEAVADHAVDPLHAGPCQRLDEQIGDLRAHGVSLS